MFPKNQPWFGFLHYFSISLTSIFLSTISFLLPTLKNHLSTSGCAGPLLLRTALSSCGHRGCSPLRRVRLTAWLLSLRCLGSRPQAQQLRGQCVNVVEMRGLESPPWRLVTLSSIILSSQAQLPPLSSEAFREGRAVGLQLELRGESEEERNIYRSRMEASPGQTLEGPGCAPGSEVHLAVVMSHLCLPSA